jgi:flagellar hook assembly protein FlgD
MKKNSVFLLFLIILFSQQLQAVDIKNVVAYPVPFDPHKNKLTIGYPVAGGNFNSEKVKAYIYDINGDTVTVISTTAGAAERACIWNGRRSNGEYAKPGLYLIKIEISDSDGGYWKKVLRVLVKY